MPYRPHVTLGVYHELDVEAFSFALRRDLVDTREIPLELSSIGMFPNDPPVVFLSATQTTAIHTLHHKVHVLLAEFGSNPIAYYSPNRWNPHCTLAPAIKRENIPPLFDFLADLPLPICGRIDRLGVIDTPAELELGEVKLSTRRRKV